MLAKCLLSKSQIEEVKLFYSYAHEDKTCRDEVDEVLACFNWDVAVRAWYDREIRPGTDWDEQIKSHVDSADFVILFVTQSFVNSQYCMESELPRALGRQARGEVKVIPILIEETTPHWTSLPFSRLQVLPPGGLPLSQWQDKSQGLRETIHEIINAITEPSLEGVGRIRWKTYLDAELGHFSLTDEAAVIAALRDISGDETMRNRGTSGGNVVLDMDSTRDGFHRVRQWFNSPAPKKALSRFDVIRVIEWYGATAHASATIGIPPPDEPPGDENLQFPTKPGIAPFLKAITVDPNASLTKIDFIIDSGNLNSSREINGGFEQELAEDFLTCLATPGSELWVNLSPNDNARLLGKTLQGTRVGRTLLEHDLLLKRLASSLLHPDYETGAAYWGRVFSEAKQLTGTLDHPFNIHPRVWIIPEKADILVADADGNYEGEGEKFEILKGIPDGHSRAILVRASVKVMCEEDYFAGRSGLEQPSSPIAKICHNAFTEIVLPVIQEEVTTGRAFAGFCQFYRTLALAAWMKTHFRDNPNFNKYFDTGDPRQLQPQILQCVPFANTAESTATARTEPPQVTGLAEARDSYTSDVDEGIRLREIGEYERSEEILQRVLKERFESLGEQHHLSQVAMTQLGRTLLARGELVYAEELHRKVLEIRRRILGDRHEYTTHSMRILANTLTGCGKAIEASQLIAQAAALDAYRRPECQDPHNRNFYDRYLKIYRDGVFFVQKHEFEPSRKCRVTRAYFSGAIDFRSLASDCLSLRRIL